MAKAKVIKEFICTECGEPCSGTIVDFGIGRGEAHGIPFNDVDKQFVSECCEAEMEDEMGFAAEPPGDPRDEYDPSDDPRFERDDEVTSEAHRLLHKED